MIGCWFYTYRVLPSHHTSIPALDDVDHKALAAAREGEGRVERGFSWLDDYGCPRGAPRDADG